MNKRLLLAWAVVCGALTAAALPVTQAIKAFSAGKAGELHGTVDFPAANGAQGLSAYLPGTAFHARLATSGEFRLHYVPPGSYTLVVADAVGRVLHSEPGLTVESREITELGVIALTPDSDGDGFAVDVDCNDLNASVYPGAVELADGLDNDCDGLVDEGLANWTDADSDGYPAQAGWSMPPDCDDADPMNHPGAVEVCDGRDNDCDGLVDEGWDLDGDGFTACDGDCDDTDSLVHPGADESTDNDVDDDCDGLVDEDFDGDLDGFTPAQGDCNDWDATMYPGAEELPNGFDDDCDGEIDEDVFHVESISPSAGGGGDTVYIFGTNLAQDIEEVTWNGDPISAVYHPWGEISTNWEALEVVAPPLPVGSTVQVVVRNYSGHQVTNVFNYIY